jgi:hypothetical protein
MTSLYARVNRNRYFPLNNSGYAVDYLATEMAVWKSLVFQTAGAGKEFGKINRSEVMTYKHGWCFPVKLLARCLAQVRKYFLPLLFDHFSDRRKLSKALKIMVGPCGLEPQTSTVSR